MVRLLARAQADCADYIRQVLGLEVRFQSDLCWKGSEIPQKRYRRVVASPCRIVAQGLC